MMDTEMTDSGGRRERDRDQRHRYQTDDGWGDDKLIDGQRQMIFRQITG